MTSDPRPADEADDVWDGLFHGCAWAAFVELTVATGGPPPAEPTRRLAYRLYEEELARRTAARGQSPAAPTSPQVQPPTRKDHP